MLKIDPNKTTAEHLSLLTSWAQRTAGMDQPDRTRAGRHHPCRHKIQDCQARQSPTHTPPLCCCWPPPKAGTLPQLLNSQQDQVHDVTLVHVCMAGREGVSIENWLVAMGGPSSLLLGRTDLAPLRWRQLLRAQAGGADVQLPWGRPGAVLPHCGLRMPAPFCGLLMPAGGRFPWSDATTSCQCCERQCRRPMVPDSARGRSGA